MSSMERKHQKNTLFFLNPDTRRKTSAEIVTEARRSLRTLHTQRPFTPRDNHRYLFGETSSRTHDGRPPSTFSLYARNFETPDSRPGSGTRLSPLEHKPLLAVAQDVDPDPVSPKPLPKPPSDPLEPKTGVAGARARLLRVGSLTTLPPVARPEGKARGREEMEKRMKRRARREKNGETMGTEREGDINVVDLLCDACDRLHGALAEQGMLGRRCSRRSVLLRTLFRLIDLDSAQLNLHLAKLTLALSVSGNNLLNICKLIFKISRSESNDILFQNNSIIDSLLNVLRLEDVFLSGEAVLYCVGTLKFLSGNIALLRLLLAKDFVAVATVLLQNFTCLCFFSLPHLLSLPPFSNLRLPQLTATLRNLADLSESRPLFVSHGTLTELCQVLRCYQGDQDVCTNVARVFSKLSSYTDCCLALAQIPGCCSLFIEMLSKHQRKQDLVLRLLFTLGNLTSQSDETRELLFAARGCMSILLGLYRLYGRRREPREPREPPAPHTPPVREPSDPSDPDPLPMGLQETEDVLVKLVRVVANMSIHPTVGPALAANTQLVDYLLDTLEFRSIQESEELLVNVAATINNLSFYQEDGSVVRERGLTVAKLVLKLLLSSSTDAILEATRVFGNLSQSSEVRQFILCNKVHRFVVTLLDSKSPEVCFSACGVLTNLALDPSSRTTLTQEGTHTKLADCLRDFGPVDWQLAGLVCRTLWNITEDSGTKTKTEPPCMLDHQEKEALQEVLTLYLEALQWTAGDAMSDFHRACWEMEFLPVAQRLRKEHLLMEPTLSMMW
uniref:Armadillo repeat containing 2 n=1 Tax=Esox lucius TaxID=8010 RepID=A0A6Q2YMV7_ESOLU